MSALMEMGKEEALGCSWRGRSVSWWGWGQESPCVGAWGWREGHQRPQGDQSCVGLAGSSGTPTACSLKQAERDRGGQNTQSVSVNMSTDLLALISLWEMNCVWDLHVLGLQGELQFGRACVRIPASSLGARPAFGLHCSSLCPPGPCLPWKACQERKASPLSMIQHRFDVHLENYAHCLLPDKFKTWFRTGYPNVAESVVQMLACLFPLSWAWFFPRELCVIPISPCCLCSEGVQPHATLPVNSFPIVCLRVLMVSSAVAYPPTHSPPQPLGFNSP